MTKHLLAMLAVLLLTSVSARAALTFGVVPSADFMVQSVPQAQRFAEYLEEYLGEPVAIRIFTSDDELRNALAEERIDLAAVKGNDLPEGLRSTTNPNSADVFVIRSGLDAGLRARLNEALAAMEKDSDGQTLLYGMRLRRFSPASDVNSRKVTPSAKPLTQRRNATRAFSTQKPASMMNRGFGDLTLGMVADSETPLRNLEAAKDFAGKLGQHLKSRVALRTFDDEITLHDWFKRYRMVDLAFYSQKFLQGRLAGEFKFLAQPADLAGQGLPAETCLVARPGLTSRLIDRLRISLEQIKGAPLVARSARASESVPVKSTVSTVSPEVIRQTPPSSSMAFPTTFTSSRTSGRKYTFGALLAPGALLRNEEQARAFARLFGVRLDATVNVKTFQDTEMLHEWLNRYRMVDVGFMDEAYLKKQPAGEFIPLLSSSQLGGSAGFRLVGRQGLDKESLNRIQDSLQQMKNDSEVADILKGVTPGGTSGPGTPSTAIVVRPAPVPAPVVAEPEPMVEPPVTEPEPQSAPETTVSAIVSQPEPSVPTPAIQPESIVEPSEMKSAKLAPEVAAAPAVSQPEAPGVTPSVAQPASAPPVIKPDAVVVPMSAPVVPIPPPVKEIASIPSVAEPEPMVESPVTEPQVSPLPSAPPERPVAKRPEPPEVVFRPSVDRKQVFLVPFTTVMVPLEVETEVFDNFVDDLGAGDMGQRYEFIILKGGLDSVDESWLAQHTYVIGEVFSYVEESGCCSTDIRAKSRVSLFREGNPVPVLKHEYPVKTFFDHDYSTIEKERRKLADNIATELASKVRETLGGA